MVITMKSKAIRMLIFLLSLLFVSYGVIEIVSRIESPYTTEPALLYEISDTEILTGVYVRDEKAISERSTGVVMYPKADGSRVTPGEVIAYGFDSSSDIIAQQDIENLTAVIESLEQVVSSGAVMGANTTQLNNEIFNSLATIKYQSDSGLMEEYHEDALDLNSQLAKKSLQLQEGDNIVTTINNYKNLCTQLETKVSSWDKSYYSSDTGYFVAGSDGLEDSITTDNIYNFTVAEIRDILTTTPDKIDNIGRIVMSHNWDILAPVNEDNINKFTIGGVIEVDFLAEDIFGIPAVVSDIVEDENGESYVILSCNYVYDKLISQRSGEIRVHFTNYEGIRISTQSIRFLDGVRGVYLIKNNTIQFKPIDVIYNGEGFALVSTITSDTNTLAKYDNVVTEGADLYDGKKIQTYNR